MAETNQPPIQAQAPGSGIARWIERFRSLPANTKVLIIGGGAALVAIALVLFLWSGDTGNRVLFSNLSEKDGGEIVTALQKLNVPYKVEAGGSISVPADQVYDLRLKLAAQGLPKGGNVGFELVDNQKFGITQFGEQINYQRAIEGELARSIESIQAVESARIHLAVPKQTVFVRDQEQPTASVLLTLRGGRVLDQGQVAAIVHLVASSLPQLNPKNVTVVDQYGNLLTGNDQAPTGLDSKQLAYLRRVEQDLVKRIEAILKPIYGEENIRAEVNADLDFDQNEQTAEIYKPNPEPNEAAVRSRQTVESYNNDRNGPQGVPGALSNQPAGAASAPLSLPARPTSTTTLSGQAAGSVLHRESTTNYEVDKTIRHTKVAVGAIKRLSAAVVVNNKLKYENGKPKFVPISAAEMAQITALAKEAVGYNQTRGDSINVVNLSFNGTEDPDLSLMGWLQKALQRLLQFITDNPVAFLKYLFYALVTLYVLMFVVRPIIKRVTHIDKAAPAAEGAAAGEENTGTAGEAAGGTTVNEDGVVVNLSEQERKETEEERQRAIRMASYAQNVEAIRDLIKEDPRIVASIVREWLTAEDAESGKK